jgi:hypothetical protein
MAIINNYPEDIPNVDDLLLGTKVSTLGNSTKNFTVSSIIDLSNAYKSLVQLLTQTGTDAPVATEVYNNTGETYTWSYVSAGTYRITSAGTPFTVDKTIVFMNKGSLEGNTSWDRISNNVIEVTGLDITNGSFEVKIYN